MSQNVLLWLGPVSTEIIIPNPKTEPDVPPVLPADWAVKTCNKGTNGGTGSDAFKNWALELGPDPISRLAPKASRVVIAGFSAAHGAIEVILGRATTDPRIVGLLALDAYYSAWKVHTPKPGYLAWLQVAMARGLPAWLTTSTHHPPQHPSASESIQPLAKALELQEVEVPSALRGEGLPVPLARGRGSVVWLDYTAQLKHTDHAWKLARPALRSGPFFSAVPQTQSMAPAAPQPPAHGNALPKPPPAPAPMPARSNALPSPPAPPPAPVPPPPPSSSWGAAEVALGITAVFGLGWFLLRRP